MFGTPWVQGVISAGPSAERGQGGPSDETAEAFELLLPFLTSAHEPGLTAQTILLGAF